MIDNTVIYNNKPAIKMISPHDSMRACQVPEHTRYIQLEKSYFFFIGLIILKPKQTCKNSSIIYNIIHD